MLELMPRLRSHFDQLEGHFRCFLKYGVQVEGWLKGELLVALNEMLEEGIIGAIDREVRVGSKRIDFVIETDRGPQWVEAKHWLVGDQKDTHYDATFYFNDPTSVGITRDIRALQHVQAEGVRWLLMLLAANPGIEDWQKGITQHRTKFGHDVAARTDPRSFPKSYFIGLVEVFLATSAADSGRMVTR